MEAGQPLPSCSRGSTANEVSGWTSSWIGAGTWGGWVGWGANSSGYQNVRPGSSQPELTVPEGPASVRSSWLWGSSSGWQSREAQVPSASDGGVSASAGLSPERTIEASEDGVQPGVLVKLQNLKVEVLPEFEVGVATCADVGPAKSGESSFTGASWGGAPWSATSVAWRGWGPATWGLQGDQAEDRWRVGPAGGTEWGAAHGQQTSESAGRCELSAAAQMEGEEALPRESTEERISPENLEALEKPQPSEIEGEDRKWSRGDDATPDNINNAVDVHVSTSPPHREADHGKEVEPLERRPAGEPTYDQADLAHAGASPLDQEERVDPDDGKGYTFEAMRTKYRGLFSEEEILAYWRDDCAGAAVGATPEPAAALEVAQEMERHPHQDEEWYQKWLRRQKNKPRQVLDISGDQPAEPEQEREDDGQQKLASQDAAKPHENEEWYQKWLRRQEHRPRKIIYIGSDQPQEQQEKAEEREQKQDEADTGESGNGSAAVPEEAGRKSYENEEWYQKWLRRQKNKGRQIIELGADRASDQDHEPTPPQQASSSSVNPPQEVGAGGGDGEAPVLDGTDVQATAEKRKDPDDGKWYSFDGLTVKYKGHFSDDEIMAWWNDECKSLAPGETAEPSSPQQPDRKAYENEEWYQKWLRRQSNKNRQIIEIG